MYDDFFFIAPTREKCQADLHNFLRMCDFLGVPIAEEKTVGAFTTLQFAGNTLDSVRQVCIVLLCEKDKVWKL